MTWEIIMRVAERIRDVCPTEADKLLFVASDVRWLETMAHSTATTDEVSTTQLMCLRHARPQGY